MVCGVKTHFVDENTDRGVMGGTMERSQQKRVQLTARGSRWGCQLHGHGGPEEHCWVDDEDDGMDMTKI